MRLLITCLLLSCASLALAKGDAAARRFAHDGAEGTVTLARVAADPERAIDLVLVADGYDGSKRERKRFARDAGTIGELFDEVEPFRTYRALFSVHVVYLPVANKEDSRLGVEVPHPEPRNLMTFDRARLEALLQAAGLADAELVHVLYDLDRFGGTAYSGEGLSISSRNAGKLNRALDMGLLWTVAHELGHSVAGLVEERPGGLGAARRCAAEAGALPNAFAAPAGAAPSAAQAPWAAWLPAEPELALRDDDDYPFARRFDPDRRPVGFFAGAGSLDEGAFRAQEHCLMRSDAHRFCVVCRQALIRAFHALSTPLRLEAIPGDAGVRLRAISGVPAEQRALVWSAPGASAEVAALLAEATRAQRFEVDLPAGTLGVRCTLTDTTPWVRGAAPVAVAVWPRPRAGAVGALGQAPEPTSKRHGTALREPDACWVPTPERPAPAALSSRGPSPGDLTLGD